MRAREFLVEYKRDITLQNYREKLILRFIEDITTLSQQLTRQYRYEEELKSKIENLDAYNTNRLHNQYADVVHENNKILNHLLSQIESIDPSPNKQYVQWLIRAYINKIYPQFEDLLANGQQFLQKFHWLKVHKKLSADMSDINRLKTYSQYREWLTEINWQYKTYNKADNLPKGNFDVLLDDDEITVYQAIDQDAACYLGQDTEWCTAVTGVNGGRTHNYFNDYNKKGPLYIIIPKNTRYDNEKYQLHFETKQYMDQNDEPVNDYDLIETWPQLHKLFHKREVERGNKTAFTVKPGLLDDWEDTLKNIHTTMFNNLSSLERMLKWAPVPKEGYDNVEFYNRSDVNDWGNYVDGLSSNDKQAIKAIIHSRNDIVNAALKNLYSYGNFSVSYSDINEALNNIPKVKTKEDMYDWRLRIYYAAQRTIDNILFPKELIKDDQNES